MAVIHRCRTKKSNTAAAIHVRRIHIKSPIAWLKVPLRLTLHSLRKSSPKSTHFSVDFLRCGRYLVRTGTRYDLFVPQVHGGTDRTTVFSPWERRSSKSRTLVNRFHFSETLVHYLSIRDYISVKRQQIHPVSASFGPSKHRERRRSRGGKTLYFE